MSDSANTMSAKERAGWIHFGVLTGFLLVVAVGWTVAMNHLGYWLRKEPIAWPTGVRVNSKTFQNTSFAKRFGPYRLARDGDQKHPDDMLSTLKIGSTLDGRRHKERKSNWYINRLYEDTSEPENSPYRYWHLDIVCYTGGEVTVPHVPDICVLAGGAEESGRDVLRVTIPDAPEPWKNKTEFVALHYEIEDNGHVLEHVQYYLFDVNGLPETRRENVRLKLANPMWRYVFYSKIQFALRRSVGNTKEADEKAKKFLRYCLPAVLKELPAPEAILRLYETDGSN